MRWVLTAVVSCAGGFVAHGIYFLTHAAYGFDDRQNLWLAFALFLPYVPAALLAGPLSRRVAPRRLLHALNGLMIFAGLVLALRPPALLLWLAAPLYNGVAGMFWPLIEAYVAGGEHGAGLHRAIGRFNLTWSLALAPAMWIVALAGDRLWLSFGALLLLHLVAVVAIAGLPERPAPHDDARAAAPPAHYPRLLWASRVLLPVSYVLMDALSPLLPGVWARVGVAAAWGPSLSSTWMLARFGAFGLLSRWSGWRGSRGAVRVGCALLLAGFAATLTGPGTAVVLLGLAAFGAGQGTLYYGALYYGMAVGRGEVDQGGRHEAVIGAGYLLGPVLALVGLGLGLPPVHAVGALATVGVLVGLGALRR